MNTLYSPTIMSSPTSQPRLRQTTTVVMTFTSPTIRLVQFGILAFQHLHQSIGILPRSFPPLHQHFLRLADWHHGASCHGIDKQPQPSIAPSIAPSIFNMGQFIALSRTLYSALPSHYLYNVYITKASSAFWPSSSDNYKLNSLYSPAFT